MKKNSVILACIAVASCVVLLSTSCVNNKKDILYACDSTSIVSYSQTVKPILDNNCNSCHSTASAQALGGGTILDDSTQIINWTDTTGGNIPGLWNACTKECTYPNRMPKGGAPLSDCDVIKIKNWIYQGVNFHN
jgi:hypothetical protein